MDSETREISAYTYVSLLSPQAYTFASCLQGPHDTDLQLAYLALSLGFGSYVRDGDARGDPDNTPGIDIVAFLMIAVCSYKSSRIFGASGLFERLVQDATVYFLVIVWVHLTVTIFTSRMGDVSYIQSQFAEHTFLMGGLKLSHVFSAYSPLCEFHMCPLIIDC